MKSKMSPVIILILLIALRAKSGPANDNYSSDLVNLNYYPHQHRFENLAHVSTALVDATTSSAGSSSTTQLTEFYESLTYGISKGLRIGINDTLVWDQSVDTLSAAQAETNTVSAGPSNPALNVAYRYLENHRLGFSGDIGLSVTPSLGPKISAEGSNGATGNNLSPGWIGDISTSVFWRHGFNESEFNFSCPRYFYGQTRGAAGAITVTDPYWEPAVTLTDRMHFSAKHFLQLAVAYTFLFDHTAVSPAAVSTQTQSGGNLSPSLLWGYSPDPEIVVQLSANFHQGTARATTISAADITTAQASTLSTTITATIALLHQF